MTDLLDLIPVPERFRSYVEVKPHPTMDTPCWCWRGMKNRNGYGRLWCGSGASRKRVGAHRVVYEEVKGPIPDKMVLDHRCDVRHCVNPAHVEPVTVQENTHRGRAVLFKPKTKPEPMPEATNVIPIRATGITPYGGLAE